MYAFLSIIGIHSCTAHPGTWSNYMKKLCFTTWALWKSVLIVKQSSSWIACSTTIAYVIQLPEEVMDGVTLHYCHGPLIFDLAPCVTWYFVLVWHIGWLNWIVDGRDFVHINDDLKSAWELSYCYDPIFYKPRKSITKTHKRHYCHSDL